MSGSSPTDPGGTRGPVRMCVRCGVVTETPVVISVVHQNTGPGFTFHACPTCAVDREQRDHGRRTEVAR
jgi:succinate dehydrogenase/fumarate reductase-like Fe-S protein